MSEKKNLKELYIHELKDIYSANKQAAEATAMFSRKTGNADVRKRSEEATDRIKRNYTRLEAIAASHG